MKLFNGDEEPTDPAHTENLMDYPSFFRFPDPHPLKELYDRLCISSKDLHLSLKGWPKLPDPETLIQMLEGQIWLPWSLEVKLWRSLYSTFKTRWWKV